VLDFVSNYIFREHVKIIKVDVVTHSLKIKNILSIHIRLIKKLLHLFAMIF